MGQAKSESAGESEHRRGERSRRGDLQYMGRMIPPRLRAKAARYATHNAVVRIYLDETQKIPPSSVKRDAILLKRIADGDKKAREELITSQLPNAFWIAVDRCNYESEFPDVVQNANLGLMKALDHYKIGKGIPFEYYAVFWIRREINRTLDALRKSREKGVVSLDREAPDGSVEGDQRIDLVEDLTALSGDQIYNQERVGKWVAKRDKDLWECVIKGLTNKQRTVLSLRYEEDMKYREISDLTGIPMGTVGVVLSRTKAKLQTMMEAKGYNQGFPSLA